MTVIFHLRCFCRIAGLIVLLFGVRMHAAEPAGQRTTSRPNVVIIYCDDLGYGDLGCYGAKDIATPNIDRLAKEGIRFTRFYTAQPVCSASRAALLTGCYPNRIGIHGALGPRDVIGISDHETTLAEVVKTQGYATAIFGKWHLGHHPQFSPLRHGFDEFFGLPYSNDMWPQHPEIVNAADAAKRNTYPDLPLIDMNKVAVSPVTSKEQCQLTTWYTEHAVDFISRMHDKPFFLYVPHSMPHVPLHVSDKFQSRSSRGLYGDVIEEIDWSVGEILASLDKYKLNEKTLVIFSSDNGPWLSYGAHSGMAGSLREGKGTCWEGGVRVPFVARWSGTIPAGKVCNEPAMTIDLLPTVAGRIGAPVDLQKIDGRDVWPLLAGDPQAKNPHDAYYFYYANNELQAVMSGRWKLYLPHTYRTLAGKPGGQAGQPVAYEQRKLEQPELYDVEVDVGEQNDLFKPGLVVTKLLHKAEAARDDLGDSLTGRTGSDVRPPGRVATPAQSDK